MGEGVEGAARPARRPAAAGRAAPVHAAAAPRRRRDAPPRPPPRRAAGGGGAMRGSETRDVLMTSVFPARRKRRAPAQPAARRGAPRRARPERPQTSRIFAARMAALRAPLMATQATGTPGGICTMREQRVEAAEVARLDRHADHRQVGVGGEHAGQRRRLAGAGDEHLDAARPAPCWRSARPCRGRGGPRSR